MPCNPWTAHQKPAGKNQKRDGKNLDHHECALHCASGPHAEAVHHRKYQQSEHRNLPVANMNAGEFQKIAREGHCYRCHPAGLDNQKQHPSIEKRRQWMVHITQVGILAAHLRHAVRQLSPYKSAGERNESAGHPCAQNQPRRMDSLRHNVWIDEDARAYSSAHDQHGGVKQTQSASKSLRWLGRR